MTVTWTGARILAVALLSAAAWAQPTEVRPAPTDPGGQEIEVDFEHKEATADGPVQPGAKQPRPPESVRELVPLPEIVQSTWALALPLACLLLLAFQAGWRRRR